VGRSATGHSLDWTSKVSSSTHSGHPTQSPIRVVSPVPTSTTYGTPFDTLALRVKKDAQLGRGMVVEMAKARLALDLTIEKGRGYRSGDRDAEETTIGIIPLDAIYSPVRRVTFEVEATRVEQETAYDALILDIETDGSISPREALASAGGTLRALVALVEEVSDEPQGLELTEAGPQAAGSPDLDLPIEDLDLSERPRNCLKRAQVNTVGELLEKSEDDLLAITNFGQKSLDEVIAKLDERGLTLKGGPATIIPAPE